MTRRRQIAVVGAGEADRRLATLAHAVGEALALAGATLVCGGGGGVMEAACRGARSAGGSTVGVLPGTDAHASPPNDAVDVAVFTGMGQARNVVVVLSSAAVIAIGGAWGTLSEVALALKHRIPVVTLAGWEPARPDRHEPLLRLAATPEQAVALALELADRDRLDGKEATA